MPPDCPVPSFLVRQALLDSQYRVAGYDLRLGNQQPIPVLPGAGSISQVRDEALLTHVADMEKQGVLSGKVLVLNLSSQVADNPMLFQMPLGKIMVPFAIELAFNPSSALTMQQAGIQPLLADDGHALDLLPAGCSAVRLDVSASDALAMARRVERYRQLGAKCLVACNVDSEEAFEAGAKLGFDLFQGDFLIHPGRTHTARLDAGVMRVMALLNKARAHAPLEELETGFKQDAALSYRLLRYINSPANGLRQPVQSLGQALMWFGYEPLYRWLSLLLFSATSSGRRSDALLRNALVRARFMEQLGGDRLDASIRGGLFIVGVLSLIDSLLNRTMTEALEPLHLPGAMSDALIEGTGPYAPYLALCKASEQFDQETISSIAMQNGFSADEVNLAHVNALIWSETLDK